MLEVIIRRGEAHDKDDDGCGGYDHCYEDYNGYDHYQDYQDYRIVARMRIMMELSCVIIVRDAPLSKKCSFFEHCSKGL